MPVKIYTIKTTYESSISFDNYKRKKISEADVVRVVDKDTGEFRADLDPKDVLIGGKRIPYLDKDTGEFKGFSKFYVYNF